MDSEELEREACALVRQYGFFLPLPVRGFFIKLAKFLEWSNLEKVLEK